MASLAIPARLARSIRCPLLLRPQNCMIRGSMSMVVSTTTLHSAQGLYTGSRASGTVLCFGSTADKETNTNSETSHVQPRSLPVHIAYKLHQSGHRYLDVRTHEEFSAGHVSGALNIPYMFRDGAGMLKNAKFLEEVSSHFAKDDKIIVGCKSGRRSLMAASDLQSAGFTGVNDVAGGYSAWSEKGLPISKIT